MISSVKCVQIARYSYDLLSEYVSSSTTLNSIKMSTKTGLSLLLWFFSRGSLSTCIETTKMVSPRGARCSCVIRALAHGAMGSSILHGVDPLSYFSFQPVLHDWCNKGRGMCYPVCGMMHKKNPCC